MFPHMMPGQLHGINVESLYIAIRKFARELQPFMEKVDDFMIFDSLYMARETIISSHLILSTPPYTGPRPSSNIIAPKMLRSAVILGALAAQHATAHTASWNKGMYCKVTTP